jgi:hypothetical protein
VSREQSISISDTGVEKFVKTFPNLATINLFSTCNHRKNALPAILKNCAAIPAVAIIVTKAYVPKKTRLTKFMSWLCDKEFMPNLRYLEF